MKTKKSASHLLLIQDEHSGRDEMNLAGHPFALLQSPQKRSENSIFYDWKRTIDGREVTASWQVETPAAFGLPGPEEELLYLVLLQLTREAAEDAGAPRDWPLVVKFSRGDVLRRLGWDNGARRYAALELAFKRLKAVSIFAKYAFYDARTKTPVDAVGFGMINEFSLVAEPCGRKGQSNIPLSHFEWNTVLHTSFLAGNVRSLALDFTISLDHPTSRRLFRLLELLRYANKPPRPQISIGLEKLRDRLGMTSYKYPSQIAQKLAPAVEELVKRGYLDGMAVEKDAKGEPMAVFRFRDSVRPGTRLPAAKAPETPVAAPQTRNEAPPVDLSNLAALLPSFEVPSPSDFNDPVGDQLDAFFETLPQDERDEIDARIRAALPEMLRDNPRSSGAVRDLARGRRRAVQGRYLAIARHFDDSH